MKSHQKVKTDINNTDKPIMTRPKAIASTLAKPNKTQPKNPYPLIKDQTLTKTHTTTKNYATSTHATPSQKIPP